MASSKSTWPSGNRKSDFISRQKQFNDELKEGVFYRLYLISGEQAYLRLQNRDKLVRALMGDGDEMNLTRYTGAGVTAREIIEMAQTLPFFADRRVIVLENTCMLNPKSAGRAGASGKTSAGVAAEAEELAGYIEDIPDTAAIIMVEENIDRRSRLFKAITKLKKNGLAAVLECDTPDEAALRAWAGTFFRKEGLQVSGHTLAFFLQYTGEDMQNIASEAQKLSCYCMGRREITESDIRDVCSPRIRDRIFEMIEAIAVRDRKKALKIYMDLCALQTAPQIILALMLRQFNQLLQVKELSGTMSDREIASTLGIPPFVVSKRYRPALKSYSSEELFEALDECVNADQEYKSGRIDAGIAVEMIIIRHTVKVSGKN